MIIAILCSISVALLGSSAALPRQRMLHQSSLIQDQIEASMDTVIHKSIGPHTLIYCSLLCLVEQSCRSLFYVRLTGYCQIHNMTISVLTDPTEQHGSRYYITNEQADVDCGNPPEVACLDLTTSGTRPGDTATYRCLSTTSKSSTQTCADDGRWSGDLRTCYCDCKYLFDNGVTESGVYPMNLKNAGQRMVYCDMEQDGGWSVLQRRLNYELDFNKSNAGYRRGFGEPDSSHWLGLEAMDSITKSQSEVIMTFSVQPGNTQHTLHYSCFDAGSRFSNFSITVSGYMSDSTWEDVFSEQTGQPFSMKGKDHDLESEINCAQQTGGGWWFSSCSFSLNGKNASVVKPSSSQSFSVSPPTEIKVRRRP